MTIWTQQTKVTQKMIHGLSVDVIELKRYGLSVPISDATTFTSVLFDALSNQTRRQVLCRIARMFSFKNFLKGNFGAKALPNFAIQTIASCSKFECTFAYSTT